MNDIKVPFSFAQKRSLWRLGLIDAQIHQLETVGLPTAIAWFTLTSPARQQDVAYELSLLAKTLKTANKKMARLVTASAANKALFEVQQRIFKAAYDTKHHLEIIKSTNVELGKALAVVERATIDLPRAQRRNQTASPQPVKIIDDALCRGFANGHPPDRAIPPYTLRRSSSPTSAYRKIIRICYQAMGQKNADPERAIKAFIRWSKDGR